MTLKNRVLIGEDWLETEDKVEVRNPYTGEVVDSVYRATAVEAEQAIEAAAQSFRFVKQLPTYERADILYRTAAGIQERSDEIARLITAESGKPIKFSKGEVDRSVVTFTLAAEETKRLGGELIPVDLARTSRGRVAVTRRFPMGPILGISPFNFPINLAAHKVAPALAAGNTFVLKPPSASPLTGLLLGEIIRESGAPPGMINVVPCSVPVAEHLAKDDRFKLLTFTGSVPVGFDLKRIAGKKRVVLELGGNAAAVVHEDADLDFAVPRLVTGSFAHAGQVCISVQRIMVHDTIYDTFEKRFVDAALTVKAGDPTDPETVIGPMISVKEAERIESWIQEAAAGGADILTGGKRNGAVVEATVMTNVAPDMAVSCKEAFAPVVVLSKYSDFEAAVREVNNSVYGLQAGVFTRDIARIWHAFREIETGGVIINDYPTFRVDNFAYGGVKDSGIGREGVKYAIEEMTELKTLILNLSGLHL
ncbi:aldehyde dehydrogenase family protein [candidate division KSB1 bacterium]